MNCPNCHEPLEAGAAFCGNCGQPLSQAVQPAQTPVVPGQPVDSYALAVPNQYAGETKALLSLLLGVAGLAGALFMALVGLMLGIAGLVMGTLSRSSPKRGLSTAGLIVSSLAITASLAVWAYAASHDPRLKPTTSNASHSITAPAVAASGVTTPCYSLDFLSKLNVTNNANSCDMNAFNGPTLETSTEVYKVYADTSQVANAGSFTSVAKTAIEKDIQANLPGFTINDEQNAEFAGSPAYIVNASETAQHFAIVEAAVFHQTASGDNVFILVHAINGDNTDLKILETQWQWK